MHVLKLNLLFIAHSFSRLFIILTIKHNEHVCDVDQAPYILNICHIHYCCGYIPINVYMAFGQEEL